LASAISNRQIARTLGVGPATIDRDIASNEAAINGSSSDAVSPNALNEAPTLSGRQAAVTVDRRERSSQPRDYDLQFMDFPEGRYPILYADPPWRYENPPMGGSNRSIENHYPTMALDELCALPAAQLATDDALLYLWATAPKLAECFAVIEAWGFTYRTNIVWVKDKIGMGYHARSQHELLLIAKRGELPPPHPADRQSSVIFAERSEHSAKPAAFYELIERWYPTLPKLELFARCSRDGWTPWGNQVAAEAAE
jgi:N6-adenosine-specific RNA methylase IME4